MKLSKVLGVISLLVTLATSAAGMLSGISPKYAAIILAVTAVVSALTKSVHENIVPIVEPVTPPAGE